MKKLNTLLTGFALLGTLGFAFSSCTPTTSAPANNGAAPSAVMAMPLTATSITVTWTRDVNDLTADTVVVTGSGSSIAPIAIQAPGNTTPVTGLASGVIYSITVRGAGGVSSPVTWPSSATRTLAVRIWETAAPTASGFSGLQLSNASGSAVAVSFRSPTASTADFILATTSDPTYPSGLILESPDVINPTYHVNALSDTAMYSTSGLDGLPFGRDLSLFSYATSGAQTSIPNDAVYTTVGSKLKLVKTSDGHYAKLAIKPQTGGKLYGTSGGFKFIDVDVSYQSMASVPYAARPHAHGTGPSLPHMTQ